MNAVRGANGEERGEDEGAECNSFPLHSIRLALLCNLVGPEPPAGLLGTESPNHALSHRQVLVVADVCATALVMPRVTYMVTKAFCEAVTGQHCARIENV